MEIIFATSNAHKASEVNQILGVDQCQLKTLKDIGFTEDIAETGATLNENAWIKTDHIHRLYGGNVIAEDTGLEVFALDMEPGVYSARYAGSQRSDQDNMNKLLNGLVDKDNRKAQFRTVVALILNDERHTFEGIVSGHIAESPTGNGGFGYDPIFVPDGYSESFGVLSAEVKNSISHRGRAFAQVAAFLKRMQKTL